MVHSLEHYPYSSYTYYFHNRKLRRAKQCPLFKPEGVAESLHGSLHGFAKIKPKSLSIRIVYRPVDGKIIRMEVIAIGPRDKEKSYRMAAQRLQKFFQQMVSLQC